MMIVCDARTAQNNKRSALVIVVFIASAPRAVQFITEASYYFVERLLYIVRQVGVLQAQKHP